MDQEILCDPGDDAFGVRRVAHGRDVNRLLDDAHGRAHRGVEALEEPAHERNPGAPSGVDETPRVVERVRERLLDERRTAGLERSQGPLHVGGGRRRHDHRLAALETVDLGYPAGAEAVGERFSRVAMRVDDARQPRVLRLRDHPRVEGAHRSGPDEDDVDRRAVRTHRGIEVSAALLRRRCGERRRRSGRCRGRAAACEPATTVLRGWRSTCVGCGRP